MHTHVFTRARFCTQANLNSKLAAIQTSINAGTLEAPEALYRWKETRRDGAESARQTNLATQVVEELPFKVRQGTCPCVQGGLGTRAPGSLPP